MHGGGYETGNGNLDASSLVSLLSGRLIVVSLNYRLAALGFLAVDALEGANYGFADQMEALRWIKTHIADFGGDPARVTVMGESSGGTSTKRFRPER